MSLEELSGKTEEAATGVIPSGEGRQAGGGGATGRPPSRTPPISKGSLLLVGLFIAGIVCIYLLGRQSGPSEASAEQNTTQTQVENALSRLKASAGSRTVLAKKDDAVIKALSYDASRRQIPLANLRGDGNPFVFTRAPAGALAMVNQEASLEAMGQEEDQTRGYSQALMEAEKLTLQTILTGSSGSMAMISNNLLTEGQKIRGWTVSTIGPNEVVLTWKNKTYVMKLQRLK
ncbi:MAG: hypothetical protein ACYTF6_02075 [Planctomycetota bacterium]|jgi:hypothetical protein